jgi:hypothetical protein
MRFTCFAFLLSLCVRVAAGQSERDSLIHNYIEKADTLIVLKFSFNNEFERFEQRGDNFYYDIRPNVSVMNRLSFSYRFLSAGFSFKAPFFPYNHDNDQRGKTNLFSLGFKLTFNKWIQELGTGYAEGFYINNTIDFIPGWDEANDPYLQVPELGVYYLRGSTQYKMNPNFSLKAISDQTERQLKSCGSFIPQALYSYYLIENESNDHQQTSSQRSNNLDLQLALGYAYTYVLHKKWYTSAGLFAGGGVHKTWLETTTPQGVFDSDYTDAVYSASLKAGMGYASHRFVSGFEFSVFRNTRKENSSALETDATRQYLHVFIGIRLGAPNFVRKSFDKATEIVPILE